MIQPTFRVFGEQAILVEWPFEIEPQGHAQLLTYRELLALFNESILETVVTYNSIAIYVKPKVDTDQLITKIKSTISLASIKIDKQVKIWEVPCCYDQVFAVDSDRISKHCKLDFDACVALHLLSEYRIYFHGFLPGFLYLGGLDPKLHVPRRPTPRTKVDKGTVAIGAMQTGIYPLQCPGGWNILGRTPLNLFDPHNSESPSPFRAGDYLQFKAITLKQFDSIKNKVEKGRYKLKSKVKDD